MQTFAFSTTFVMRRLPTLAAGPHRWVLPMSDASALHLADALLADNCAAAQDSLAEALLEDPPLALWAVCVAARRDGFHADCLDDLARWMARHLLEVFRWEEPRAKPRQEFDSQRCAELVTAAVQAAELANRLCGGAQPRGRDLSFLLGLLHGADAWLALAADGRSDDSTCLPGWIADPGDVPAAESVRRAEAILEGETAPADTDGIELDACRRRAEEVGRRWTASLQGLGPWLPQLATKLVRLQALESRFQQVLETEKLEAMAEFAAGAGHEINNPLTVIAGRAQLFLREETDPERRRALALINTQAKRIYEMIADMMLFARAPHPQAELIDLVELIDRVVAEISPEAARREIAVSRSGEHGPTEVEADPVQLTVALHAMCRNSIEAIGREGNISIGLRDLGGEVEIRVSDDGPGISPQERRHLFDPYYSARQAGRGLGLGLSKCWRIVTNHGGRIEANSAEGQGAEFVITLPRRAPEGSRATSVPAIREKT